jgi:hypothetical protein
MAKPDTDDGWIKMAHELHAALAFADFTKAQQVVLDYVFSQSFGPAKRRVVDLSPSDLATLTGLDKGSVGHAIAGLVSDGVLVKAALCRYVFAKDYERWQKAGKPRLRPVEVAYIKGAPTRSMAFRKGSTSLANQPTEALVNEPTGPLVNQPTALAIEPTGVGQRANESLVNEPTISASPYNPLYGREKGEVREDGGNAPARDEVKATDAEVARVASLCDKLDPYANGGWAQKVHQFAAMYPPAWILAACEAAAAAGKGDWRFVHAILRRYQGQGGPDVAPAGREPLTVARPEPPMPPRHVPEPEMTPEERAEYAKRFRLIVQGAAHAG